MQRKFLVSSIVLIVSIVMTFSMLGCAAPPAPEEIKPCKVELSTVYPLFLGQESVVYTAVFDISNPNDFEVTLDSFSYTLRRDIFLFATSGLGDKFFIPAGEKISIRCAFPVLVGDIIGVIMLDTGLPPGPAAATAMPVWKTLGGVLISPALQPVWDAAPEEKLTIQANGTASISGEGLSTLTEYKLSWQEP